MSKCHQCPADVDALPGKRSGKCTICYCQDDVEFCQRCAMWELGPVDAAVDLAKALRKSSTVVDGSRQDHGKPKQAVNKVAEQPLACHVFLPLMGEVCTYVEDQRSNALAKMYGVQFAVHACKVLDKFQELYPECKYNRFCMQVLLVFYLSSRERVQCRDSPFNGESTSDAAKPVKRWLTRTIARAHLEAHLATLKAKFGQTVFDFLSRPAVLAALESDQLEYFFKDLKHPTLMAIDLLASAGSIEAARETLEIGTILYHALTAAPLRSKISAIWPNNENSFTPRDAIGFLSKSHFEALYGDVDEGRELHADFKAKLARLWNVLGDVAPENQLPSHPRFADAIVENNALLDTAEKHYLQYLPTFDHPKAQKNARTACEQLVRNRVVAGLKDARVLTFRDPELSIARKTVDATTGSVKKVRVKALAAATEIELVFTKTGTFGHVPVTLVKIESDKIDPFILSLLDPAALRAEGGKLELELFGEQADEKTESAAHTRRQARKDAVEAALRESFDRQKKRFSLNTALVDDNGVVSGAQDFVDDLISKMKTDFCVDQAFDVGVSNLILTKANTNDVFTPAAWFPLKLKPVKYTTLFPACGFDKDLAVSSITEHYEATEGESPRPAHYMDWRNHKDNWLYDCFPISPMRRPVFASLSTQQPLLPAPNPLYGGHILFYSRPPLEGRCVFTFGDKQQPRRSMLLLLDTILYGRPKKDKAPAQLVPDREKILHRLLKRYEGIALHGAKTKEALWDLTMRGKEGYHSNGDLLIECQIFGGVVLTRDAWAWVPAWERADDVNFVAIQHVKEADLLAGTPRVKVVYPNLRILSYQPSALVPKLRAREQPSADAARQAPFKTVQDAPAPGVEPD